MERLATESVKEKFRIGFSKHRYVDGRVSPSRAGFGSLALLAMSSFRDSCPGSFLCCLGSLPS